VTGGSWRGENRAEERTAPSRSSGTGQVAASSQAVVLGFDGCSAESVASGVSVRWHGASRVKMTVTERPSRSSANREATGVPFQRPISVQFSVNRFNREYRAQELPSYRISKHPMRPFFGFLYSVTGGLEQDSGSPGLSKSPYRSVTVMLVCNGSAPVLWRWGWDSGRVCDACKVSQGSCPTMFHCHQV
jgi:hypothetical protein